MLALAKQHLKQSMMAADTNADAVQPKKRRKTSRKPAGVPAGPKRKSLAATVAKRQQASSSEEHLQKNLALLTGNPAETKSAGAENKKKIGPGSKRSDAETSKQLEDKLLALREQKLGIKRRRAEPAETDAAFAATDDLDDDDLLDLW